MTTERPNCGTATAISSSEFITALQQVIAKQPSTALRDLLTQVRDLTPETFDLLLLTFDQVEESGSDGVSADVGLSADAHKSFEDFSERIQVSLNTLCGVIASRVATLDRLAQLEQRVQDGGVRLDLIGSEHDDPSFLVCETSERTARHCCCGAASDGGAL